MAAAELAFGVFFVAGAHGGFFGFDFRACCGFRFGGGCGCCRHRGWRWSFWSCVSHSICSRASEIATATANSKDLTQRTQSKTGEHRETGASLRFSFPLFTTLPLHPFIPCFAVTSNSVAAEDYSAGAVLFGHRC